VLQDEILGGSQLLSDSLAESLKSRWVASYGPAPICQTASKQSTWDKSGILAESTAVEETRTSPFQQACLLAACVPHSGDWLLALPLTVYGLWLDDEAVHISVALRLGSVFILVVAV